MKDKKIYIWQSSIPEKWKKIAGEDYFVHISKSNRAKNTLEFLQETQRYIVKIRGALQESSSARRIKWPNRPKREFSDRWNPFDDRNKELKVEGEEGDTERKVRKGIEPSHSPLLPSLSEKNVKESMTMPPLPPLHKFKRNNSTNSITEKGSYLRFVNQHADYSRASHDRPPDFICLPKALKANFNRVFNSFRG